MKRIATLLALMWASTLNAQPAVLLGPDLEPRLITLQSLSAEGITYLDHTGAKQSLPLGEVVRLTFAAPGNMRIDQGYKVVTLRDGQRFVGSLIGAGTAGESLRFTVPQMQDKREVEVPLDDLLTVAMRRDAVPPAVEDDDVLLLATGETLTGFVEAVSDKTISFTVGDAADPIPIPLDRVHAIAIANKPTDLQDKAGLFRVDIGDGSSFLIADAKKLAPETRLGTPLSGRLLLPVDDPQVSFASGGIERIEPLSGKYTLAALSAMPMELVAGGEVFGVESPPSTEPDGAIRLHAPTTIGFELPRNATRLTLTAALALDDELPPERRAMAGCELVIYDGDQAIGGCTLDPGKAPQRLNLPLKTRDLRIEIKPGVNGPVLDRVRLSDAEVLIGR